MPGLEIDLSIYKNEAALLEGLRRGEPDACACLIKRFAGLLYARSLQLVSDRDEAEEVLQLTFIKACEKIHSFEGRSELSTWLYRIATNEALMKLRQRHDTSTSLDDMRDTLTADDLPQNLSKWPADPAGAALDSELKRHMEVALAQLPESLRVVFTLRELQGMSTAEVASLLGLNESAVKVRLHRARLRLRELLAAYLADEGGAA